jgi:hypothetical protein
VLCVGLWAAHSCLLWFHYSDVLRIVLMYRGESYKLDSYLITDFKLWLMGIKANVVSKKYVDNLVSLSAGLRTPSEKTENMVSPRLSTHTKPWLEYREPAGCSLEGRLGLERVIKRGDTFCHEATFLETQENSVCI